MKHIKKWKSINESMSYDNVKISRNDFYTFVDPRNPDHLTLVPFSRKDIMEIEKVLSTKKLDGRISFRSPSRISEDITGIVAYISKGGVSTTAMRQCSIFKLDDEWFLYQNDLLVMKDEEYGIYIKCDQLGGLLQELDKINVLNESKGYLDDFYQEIGQDKFIEYVQSYNRITFDEKLYNKVTSLFINKPGIEWSARRDGDYAYKQINPWTISNILSKTINQKLTCGIDISVDDDEWFYVMVRGLEKTYFYKCDQIEGLKKLIEYYETY